MITHVKKDLKTRRGCVSPIVEDSFGFAGIQVVSFADLYAGMIVAAFGPAQHPRDLFDVRDLLANEGIVGNCVARSSIRKSISKEFLDVMA